MQNSEFTDIDLMSYADGELPEDRATALDAALADDPVLADRLARFSDTRALSKAALDASLLTPVPDHLVQHVRALAAADRSGVPVPANQSAAPQAPIWKLPLAASLALAMGLGAGLWLSPPAENEQGAFEIATLTDADIIAALNTIPSGQDVMLQDGARIAPIATFFDGAQTLCREFEFDRTDGTTIVSVACQNQAQWDVQIAIAAAAAQETGYAPASSLAALDAFLLANDAGAPLEPDAEAAALNALR